MVQYAVHLKAHANFLETFSSGKHGFSLCGTCSLICCNWRRQCSVEFSGDRWILPSTVSPLSAKECSKISSPAAGHIAKTIDPKGFKRLGWKFLGGIWMNLAPSDLDQFLPIIPSYDDHLPLGLKNPEGTQRQMKHHKTSSEFPIRDQQVPGAKISVHSEGPTGEPSLLQLSV